MIKAVIFDFDGVVTDTEDINLDIDYKILKSAGAVKSKKDYDREVGPPSRHIYNKILSEKNIDADVNKMLKQREKEFEKLVASKKLKPSKGFNELVKKLKEKSYKIALASSSTRRRLDNLLNNLKIKNIFLLIVSADDVEMNKPSPDIYIEAAKRLNLAPEECVAIEDSETGVASAASAGMKCIAIRTKQTAEHDLSAANMIVKSLDEITVDKIDSI